MITRAAAASPAPTTLTALVSPSSPQPLGLSTVFEAAISPTKAIGTVRLYDGTTLLDTESHVGQVWSFATTLPAGTHQLKATFTPDVPAAYSAATTTVTDVVSNTSCSLAATMVPSCGVLWGTYKPPAAGENWDTTSTDVEAQVARPFDIVYRYHDFSGAGSGAGAFPDKYEQQLAASGHVLLEDWSPSNFTTKAKYAWADIAAGKYDASVIDPEALRMRAYGKPVMLSFDHEMDIRVGVSGTAADYVDAYRHIHDQFAALGVTNVIWVWTTTGYGGHDWEFPSLYPGSAYVNWIGWDPYNFASCHSEGWKSFNQTIDPFYQFLESNGFGNKPFILPEYGTVQDPSNPSAAAGWFGQIPAALASHPNIKALLAWNDAAGKCDERISVGLGEFAAFAAAGRNPALDAHLG